MTFSVDNENVTAVCQREIGAGKGYLLEGKVICFLYDRNVQDVSTL